MAQISINNLIITKAKTVPWHRKNESMLSIKVHLSGRKEPIRIMVIHPDEIIFDIQDLIGMSLIKGKHYMHTQVEKYHKLRKLLGEK